jgi:hypothetical protein
MTINGSNFQSGVTLTFHDPQNRVYYSVPGKLTYMSSDQLIYYFNDGSDPGIWTVYATNPDNQNSNTVGFLVTQ